LGEYLENGNRIVATMNIDNSDNLHKLYKISGTGKHDDIYVTGSHRILYHGKYVLVKDCPIALIQREVESPQFRCLITDTHEIQIGQYTFWDWEDWAIPESMKQ